MPTHRDRITMIRHMVLLGALGAGAFGGRQRGDGFQLGQLTAGPWGPGAWFAAEVLVRQDAAAMDRLTGFLGRPT
jgi:hypothetical protein